MAKLLKNKKLLERICKNNVELAERESWNEIAKMTLKVYDRVLRK